MKVKCINNSYHEHSITLNKIYICLKHESGLMKIIDDNGSEIFYAEERFEEVKEMEKQIVTINVGSEIVDITGSWKVYTINIEQKKLIAKNYDVCVFFETFEKYLKDGYIKSINGIPVSEIEKVKIVGYNDKIVLKIGDELIFAKSGLAESCVGERDVDDLISKIENGEAYNRYGQKWWLGDMNEIWFVNGKKYHRNDIIIPDQVVDKHDEIDDFVVNAVVELNGVRGKVVEWKDTEFKAFYFDKPVARDGLPAKQWVINKNNLKGIKVIKEPLDEAIDQPEQDNEMVEITPENIKEVLKHNNFLYGVDYISCITEKGIYWARTQTPIYFNNPNWLQHLEIETGKLKPLPEFYFKQYLLDNGFGTHADNKDILIYDDVWAYLNEDTNKFTISHDSGTYKPTYYKQTKQNADILIQMSKLAEGLK